MKTIHTPPSRVYPYLAVFTGGLDIEKPIDIKEIVLISIVPKTNADSITYVQNLLGGKEAHPTTKEEDYKPLPANYKIQIIQE